MDTAKIKGVLLVVINLAVNGGLWLLVPEDYKLWAILGVNLLQVVYAFLDPTYTIQKLGMTKIDYFGAVKRAKAERSK